MLGWLIVRGELGLGKLDKSARKRFRSGLQLTINLLHDSLCLIVAAGIYVWRPIGFAGYAVVHSHPGVPGAFSWERIDINKLQICRRDAEF